MDAVSLATLTPTGSTLHKPTESRIMSGNDILPPVNAAHNLPTYNRIIAWLTGLLTLLLAIFAFILSFNALADLAATHGVSIPPLFPFVVEFAVVIFSLNALYRSLSGERAHMQWALIIGSSLLAGMFNVAHADPDLISRAIAGMPSLFLLLSFESFLSLIKHRVTQQGILHDIVALTQQYHESSQSLEELTHRRDSLQAQIEELRGIKQAQLTLTDTIPKPDIGKAREAKQAQIAQRRERVLALIQEGMSQPDIASELGVSLATIKRDTKTLNGRMS